MVLQIRFYSYTFILVFHRILDFKTGLNFYSDPFLFFSPVRMQRGRVDCVVVLIGCMPRSHPPFMGCVHKKAPIDIGAGTY
jgi:hypothetical protein